MSQHTREAKEKLGKMIAQHSKNNPKTTSSNRMTKEEAMAILSLPQPRNPSNATPGSSSATPTGSVVAKQAEKAEFDRKIKTLLDMTLSVRQDHIDIAAKTMKKAAGMIDEAHELLGKAKALREFTKSNVNDADDFLMEIMQVQATESEKFEKELEAMENRVREMATKEDEE